MEIHVIKLRNFQFKILKMYQNRPFLYENKTECRSITPQPGVWFLLCAYTGFHFPPHHRSPSHSPSQSFSHSVMLFSMLSFYVAHALVLFSALSFCPTLSPSFPHTSRNRLLNKPLQSCTCRAGLGALLRSLVVY